MVNANMIDKVVEAMMEFDRGLPEEIKEIIVTRDADYQNYAAVMRKLDELYFALKGEIEEDPKEIKLEALNALDNFSYKYDVDMTAIKKMIV